MYDREQEVTEVSHHTANEVAKMHVYKTQINVYSLESFLKSFISLPSLPKTQHPILAPISLCHLLCVLQIIGVGTNEKSNFLKRILKR